MAKQYDTYCPQCETRITFPGEVVVATDGTKGAQGPCPRCQTIVTAIIEASKPGASLSTGHGRSFNT